MLAAIPRIIQDPVAQPDRLTRPQVFFMNGSIRKTWQVCNLASLRKTLEDTVQAADHDHFAFEHVNLNVDIPREQWSYEGYPNDWVSELQVATF